MKVDKKNPWHWAILLISAGLLIIAIPARLLPPRKKRTVVLYGHKLNGNLLPFYELEDLEIDFYYLSLDQEYLKTLTGKARILNGLKYTDLIILARANAIITDHGLHHFVMLKMLTNCKFIDVWHGVPYKGFDAESLSFLHDYHQIWVSSKKMKEMYAQKFGFNKEKVYPIGYARVERLLSLNNPDSKKKIRDKYHLEDKKTILIAPTWQQDDKGRSIVPFGLDLSQFIGTIAKAHSDSQIIFRAHLNVKDASEATNVTPNVKIMPYAEYPVGEDFLAVSDVLISDWSSIVFDFLVLDRPVIYLDVPAPFKLGFSLGPEYRFGAVVSDKDQLSDAVILAANQPEAYMKKYKSLIDKSYEAAYGDTLDGHVMQRSLSKLYDLLDLG